MTAGIGRLQQVAARDIAGAAIDVLLYPFKDFYALVGFEGIWAFERAHAE